MCRDSKSWNLSNKQKLPIGFGVPNILEFIKLPISSLYVTGVKK